MRARIVRTAAVLAAALAAVTLSSGVAAAQDGIDYVALGDSSAAGPLIPNQVSLACTRSDRNWPRAVAARLGADLTDVTCSGAKVGDLAGRQFGVVAPQYDALRADTDLVTLAIGANDLDLGAVVPSCASPLRDPIRPTCEERYTAGGTDRLAARTAELAPRIAAALQEIGRRSPDADVVVVGYLTYWQPGGCHPLDPIPPADADYLQGTFDGLMDMLAEQAGGNGATYVDIRTPSAEHGLCAPIGQKWLEGLVPTAAAFPYHPNATGMAEAGNVIAGAIAGADTAP